MKLGILSGTFDPVHDGHIWLALESMNSFHLDKVIMLPERAPRNKVPLASYEDRLRMLKLATRESAGIEVLDTKEDSHSVKTVLSFVREKYDNPEEIWLIIGADVFENISNWDDWEQLRGEVQIIVSLRSEDDGEIAVSESEKLGVDIDMLSSEHPGVSSRGLREQIKNNDKLIGVDRDVYEYVRANRLYGSRKV